MIFWSALASIGYIILIATPVTTPGVLYSAVFLTVSSIAFGIATTIAWVGPNVIGHYEKATAMGLTYTWEKPSPRRSTGPATHSSTTRYDHCLQDLTAHTV